MTPRDALILAPAAIAAIIAWILHRFRVRESAVRYGVAVATGLAYICGFFLIYDWADALPSRHFHWLLYLAVMAAVIGPASVASGVLRWERGLMALVVASVGACTLVPTWESLSPPRTVWIPVLAAYLGLLAVAIEPLVERLSPRVVLLSMTASSFTLAAPVTAIWSVSMGKSAALPGLALLGIGAVTWFSPPTVGLRGAALIYALLTGGAAFIAGIEPDPAVWPLLAVPLAPITLWLCAVGPLSGSWWRKILGQGLLLPAFYLAGVVLWIATVYGAVDEGW